MMQRKGKDILPVTALETRLKGCAAQRPEVMDHILTGEELAEYIAWMATTYGSQNEQRVRTKLIPDLQNGKMRDLGEQILSDPSNAQTLRRMSESFRMTQEDVFFGPEYDIAVSPVIRYMPAHWHQNNYFELFYCFSGDCPLHFPNEVIHMKSGSFIIVPSGVVHASPCYADDAVLYYYLLRASTFEEVFWKQIPSENLMASFFRQALSGKQPNSYLHFETEGDEELQELLLKILAEAEKQKRYSSQLMNVYMSTCFLLLLRRYEGTARLPRTEDFYWKHEYSAILSYIQTHIGTVKLPELAARYHYSEKQIRRIVQSSTGENYTDLLARLRMEKAVKLMRQTKLSMHEIALSLGFSTVNSFYRAFTNYYGSPPVKYLEQQNTPISS